MWLIKTYTSSGIIVCIVQAFSKLKTHVRQKKDKLEKSCMSKVKSESVSRWKWACSCLLFDHVDATFI